MLYNFRDLFVYLQNLEIILTDTYDDNE